MLILDFYKWWYTAGWKLRFTSIFSNLANWLEYFSIGILLKTLFSPWKQNVSYVRPDQALNLKLNAIGDNLISRFVGFFVRLGVLFAAGVTLSLVFVVSVIFAVVWPILPFAPVGLIVFGVMS